MPAPAKLTAELKCEILLEIARRTGRALELQDVLRSLLDSLRSVVAYDAAGIFVLNESVPLGQGAGRNLIAGMASTGFDASPAEKDPMLRFGRGVIGYVIRTGAAAVLSDVRQDQRYVVGRRSTLSEIAVPIVSEGQVIGALNLESDSLAAFSEEHVGPLEFFAQASAMLIEKAIVHQQLVDKKRIEDQLRIARDVQASLLPANPPSLPGWDFAAVNLPTWDVGGDYFDFIATPGGPVAVTIADVSGKGVPAALIMATLRAALHTEALDEHDLPHVLRTVNALLLKSIGAASFVTAVYGILEPSLGLFEYINCGHNPPLLLRASGATERLSTGATVLGVFGDCEFQSDVVRLEPGDALVLYTDGVVELSAANGELFGVAGLERAVRDNWRKSSQGIVQAVVAETLEFASRRAYDDDFTLVIIRRTASLGGESDQLL